MGEYWHVLAPPFILNTYVEVNTKKTWNQQLQSFSSHRDKVENNKIVLLMFKKL